MMLKFEPAFRAWVFILLAVLFRAIRASARPVTSLPTGANRSAVTLSNAPVALRTANRTNIPGYRYCRRHCHFLL
jgi:hypothetical protein